MMVSMGIATVIFNIHMGRSEITPEQYPLLIKSVNSAFIVFTVLCAGGIFASMARGNVKKAGGKQKET